MIKEIKAALVPIMVTAAISGISSFSIAVREVSANGEQGKRNAADIKDIQSTIGLMREKQSGMDAKLDLLVERAKLER